MRQWLALAVVVALSLSLAACGSRLTPEQAVYAKSRAGVGIDPATQPPGNAGQPGGPGTTPPGVPVGDCTGFADGPGITADTITIANASDISGPMPGLFSSAQQAVQAFVAYFNAGFNICGRKLHLALMDSRTNAGGDQEAAMRACQQAFAMVGSMSGFDVGGAKTVTDCGIPDLRAASVNPERARSPVVFGANSRRINQIPAAVPDYLKRTYPNAASSAAFVYLNAGPSAVSARSFIAAWRARGFNWVYEQPIDVTDFNYAPYVLQMKQRNVRYVQFTGSYQHAVRLAAAMRQQSFKPEVFLLDPSGYHPDFARIGGAAVDGVRVFNDAALFEEAGSNPELQLYTRWLHQVAPSAVPTYFGMYAWSSARLFTELATVLGGRLNRQSLLGALGGVHDWAGHGLFAPADVGGRRTAECHAVIKLQGGTWVRESPGRFMCAGLVDTGIGT